MNRDVFISFATADKAIADALCQSLEIERLRCWIAPRDVRAGFKYAAEIVEGINGSRSLVVILTTAANKSHFVTSEVERAMNRGIPVIAFRAEQVLPGKELELFLSSRQWLDAFTPPMEDHFPRLASDLRALLASEPSAETAANFKANEPSSETTGIAGFFRRFRQSLLKGAVGVCAVLTLLAVLNCWPSQPLDRMERYRQRAEDSLNAIDWPEQVTRLLVDWERDVLKLEDRQLRQMLLTNIDQMRTKTQILARPAVKEALGASAREIAQARDRAAGTR